MDKNILSNHLADFHFEITRSVNYGATNGGAFLAGKGKPSGPGAILDVFFGGEVKGPKLNATVSNGIDYIAIRPDGRRDLDIRATFTTSDGAEIAYRAIGIAGNEDDRVVIRKHAYMFTLSEEYLWVNDVQLWVFGDADLPGKKVLLHAYIV